MSRNKLLNSCFYIDIVLTLTKEFIKVKLMPLAESWQFSGWQAQAIKFIFCLLKRLQLAIYHFFPTYLSHITKRLLTSDLNCWTVLFLYLWMTVWMSILYAVMFACERSHVSINSPGVDEWLWKCDSVELLARPSEGSVTGICYAGEDQWPSAQVILLWLYDCFNPLCFRGAVR